MIVKSIVTVLHFCPQRKSWRFHYFFSNQQCKIQLATFYKQKNLLAWLLSDKRVSQPEFTDQDLYINMILSYLEINIFFHNLVNFEKKLLTFPLFNFYLYIIRNDPCIVKNCALTKVEIMINESRDLVGEIPSS